MEPRSILGGLGVFLFGLLAVVGLRTGGVPAAAPEPAADPVEVWAASAARMRFSGNPAHRPAVNPRYVVQAGDTLSKIAVELGTTVDDLMAANALVEPDRLAPGDALVVPESAGSTG